MTFAPAPRSYLYVPGHTPELFEKAIDKGAEALILDLEDAVPIAEKTAARDTVAAWVGSRATTTGLPVWVRVNQGELGESDVRALAGTPGLTGLVLAKVDGADGVRRVADLLSELGDDRTRLMPMIESASALLEARAVAASARVQNLQLGEVDLTGELAITPGPDESELSGLRTMVVVASAAAGIASPVGPVSRLTNDPEAFRASTELVRRQGFVGRVCIHPAQLPVVHDVFTPSADEIADARSAIVLMEAAETAGTGVVLDAAGRLVDAAVLKAAARTLTLAKQAGLL